MLALRHERNVARHAICAMSDDLDDVGERASAWAAETFGPIANDPRERALRFVEEAIELAQTQGADRAAVDALASRVYSRPVGDASVEIGQVGFTLLMLAANLGVSVPGATVVEWARVSAISADVWRARHAVKIATGVALAEAPPASDLADQAAIAMLWTHAQWRGDVYTAGRLVKDIVAVLRKRGVPA